LPLGASSPAYGGFQGRARRECHHHRAQVASSGRLSLNGRAKKPSCGSIGEWNDDDFDVLADGPVVGRIFKVHAALQGSPWIWTLAFGHDEDRTPTHGYAATREAAMAAFAKGWRHE
jgi:hypothetical protein